MNRLPGAGTDRERVAGCLVSGLTKSWLHALGALARWAGCYKASVGARPAGERDADIKADRTGPIQCPQARSLLRADRQCPQPAANT